MHSIDAANLEREQGELRGIRRYYDEGDLYAEIGALGSLCDRGTPVPIKMFYSLLQACSKAADLELGRRVHALIVQSGLESDAYLGNQLIGMYSSRGRLKEATDVFDKLQAPNEFVWASLISAHVKHGQAEKAVRLYFQLRDSDVKPDDRVFVAVLKACANSFALAVGELVHLHVVETGLELNVYVGSALIDMYAKCGMLEKAHEVFDGLTMKDTVTWNTLISGYADKGNGQGAVQLFHEMQQAGMQPDVVTLLGVLKACSRIAALDLGRLTHAYLTERGLAWDVRIGNTLVDMYSKCGSLQDARRMFDELPRRDLVSWTAMITGYAQEGDGDKALNLFHRMCQECVQPNAVTLISLLKACSIIGAYDHGRLLHDVVIEKGLASDLCICCGLIDMYVKCGTLVDARKLFDALPFKDPVVWTAMISGYVQHEEGQGALEIYHQMLLDGVPPNLVVLLSALKACSSITALEMGKLVHAYVVLSGLESDVFVGSSLIHMYCKCGKRADALMLFDRLHPRSSVSWNAIIAGCTDVEDGEDVLHLFQQMEQESIRPDSITFVTILKACSSVEFLDHGRFLHGRVQECGLESDVQVCNALIDMYARCGSFDDALKIFDRLPRREAVSWTALIAGYALHGRGQEAVELFGRMEQQGMQPDKVTLLSVLRACSSTSSLQLGRILHSRIVDHKLEPDLCLANALIDMYSRCGDLGSAIRVFDRLHSRDVVSWNTIISAFAQHGCGKEALSFFDQMKRDNTPPDDKTFACLLSACSHAGLLEAGYCTFHTMITEFGMTPNMEHFSCMVDLLSRAGHLDEAEGFVKAMSVEPNSFVWMALLAASRLHGNIPLAERAFEAILKLDPAHTAAHVLMASTYASAGMRDESQQTRARLQAAGGRKEPGRTWMEVKGEVHSFVVDDTEHPERKQILATMSEVRELIRKDLARTTKGFEESPVFI